MRWRVRAFCLERQSATRTLNRIEAGELGSSILSWVVLMRGADDAALVTRWIALLKALPDEELQRDLVAIALVWIRWLGYDAVWGKPLEEFDMWKSGLFDQARDMGHQEGLTEGRKEGLLQGKRDAILELLRERFPEEVLTDLEAWLRAETDLDHLQTWFKHALRVNSITELEQLVQAKPHTNGTASP